MELSKNKYIKYKKKYLELKKNIQNGGGSYSSEAVRPTKLENCPPGKNQKECIEWCRNKGYRLKDLGKCIARKHGTDNKLSPDVVRELLEGPINPTNFANEELNELINYYQREYNDNYQKHNALRMELLSLLRSGDREKSKLKEQESRILFDNVKKLRKKLDIFLEEKEKRRHERVRLELERREREKRERAEREEIARRERAERERRERVERERRERAEREIQKEIQRNRNKENYGIYETDDERELRLNAPSSELIDRMNSDTYWYGPSGRT